MQPELLAELVAAARSQAEAARDRVDLLLVRVDRERAGSGLLEGVLLEVRVGERRDRLDREARRLPEVQRGLGVAPEVDAVEVRVRAARERRRRREVDVARRVHALPREAEVRADLEERRDAARVGGALRGVGVGVAGEAVEVELAPRVAAREARDPALREAPRGRREDRGREEDHVGAGRQVRLRERGAQRAGPHRGPERRRVRRAETRGGVEMVFTTKTSADAAPASSASAAPRTSARDPALIPLSSRRVGQGGRAPPPCR